MLLMQKAVLKVKSEKTLDGAREFRVLDLTYDPDLQVFSYVHQGTLTVTLREHVIGYRERNAADDD